jgi:hypothetical protein
VEFSLVKEGVSQKPEKSRHTSTKFMEVMKEGFLHGGVFQQILGCFWQLMEGHHILK